MKLKELFEGKGRKPTDVIPLEDDTYYGEYNISKENIDTLVGCPKKCFNGFKASINPLITTLDGGPNTVEGGQQFGYDVSLESLEGIAKSVHSVYFEKCSKLISLKNVHKHVPMVTTFRIATLIKSNILGLLKLEHLNELEYQPGYEYPDHESNKAFQILYAHLKKKDLLACQQDLIDAGLEEYAQL